MTTDSAPNLLWTLLGSPPVEGCLEASGVCYQCAGPVTVGLSVREWMSSNYTDQNRVRAPYASHVCAACVMLARRLWPVPGRPAGACKGCDGTGFVTEVQKKGKTRTCQVGDPCPKCEGSGQASAGGNWRNYSHILEQGWNSPALPDGTVVVGYANASKGEKPLILAFLDRNHQGTWFASIADSGQKHVTPWAPLNGPGRGGVVIFEDDLVAIPKSLDLVRDMASLLTAGGTKEEIDAGDYRSNTWIRCRDDIECFETAHRGKRGGGWFKLALWLAQRDERDVEARQEREKLTKAEKLSAEKEKRRANKRTTEASGDVSGGDDTRVPARVHRESKRKSHSRVLGQDPGYARGINERADDPRDGAKPTERSPNQGAGQIRLPGFG